MNGGSMYSNIKTIALAGGVSANTHTVKELIPTTDADAAEFWIGEQGYIGVDGEKELLRKVRGGESYDETITLDNKYDNEKTIYVILESTDKCIDGDFEFEYN